MKRLYCITTCTTCKKAVKDLEERGIDVEYVDLKTDPPKKEELRSWINKHPKGISAFFNTSGILYRELDMKTKRRELGEEELLEILSQEGMLVKRPILVCGDDLIVGYKKETYDAFFNKENK